MRPTVGLASAGSALRIASTARASSLPLVPVARLVPLASPVPPLASPVPPLASPVPPLASLIGSPRAPTAAAPVASGPA